MFDRTAIQSAYADFIAGFEWDWFCRLTFRDPPHPESAEKRFRFWIRKINQLIYGRLRPISKRRYSEFQSID